MAQTIDRAQSTNPSCTGSSIWHVRSAVGRRGHVTLHRHLLPSRVTGLRWMSSPGPRSGGQTCHTNQVQVSELHGSRHGCENSCCLSVARNSDDQLLAIFLHCHKSPSFFCLSVPMETSLSHNTYRGRIRRQHHQSWQRKTTFRISCPLHIFFFTTGRAADDTTVLTCSRPSFDK